MSRKFKHIAKTIKTWRKHRDISQQDLAQCVGFKNGQYISNVERGIASFPPNKILRLCEVLDMDTENIIQAIVEDYRIHLEIAVQKSRIEKVELPALPDFLKPIPPDLIYL